MNTATVTVCCCLPQGLTFTLPDGRTVTFDGCPVSRLVSPDGEQLPGGRYGITRDVAAKDWAWIKQTYGESAYFRTEPPLLFAAADTASALDQAAEQREARHGREQIDPKAGQTRTKPEGSGKAA